MKNIDLPQKWKIVQFKDIFEIRKGKKVNISENPSESSIPYIAIENLRGKPIKNFTDDEKGLLCDSNDILIVWDGANCGTVGSGLSGFVGSTIARLSLIDESIYKDYVLIFLKSKFKIFNTHTTGATIPHLDRNFLINFKIPVPPLETQKKIVEILEKAEKLKEWRAEADELADEYLKSLFLEMFGDPQNNHNNFKVGKIQDLVTKTQYGTSSKANEENKGYPILRMNNITYFGKWDFSSIKHIELEDKDKEKCLVKKGELLFNRTNSKELVGKAAVFRRDEPMAFAGYLVKLSTDSPATSEYIAAHLNSPYGKEVLFNMAKSIVGMANINAKEVQRVPILIPPMEIREKYAEIVKRHENLRESQAKSKQEIDNLFNTLMQKAFKGELVC